MYLLVWYVIWGLIKDGDRAGSIAFQEKKKVMFTALFLLTN